MYFWNRIIMNISSLRNNQSKLISRIAQGDENAFALFFKQYYPKVYTFCLTILHDRFIAEEVVQEVMLSIWNKRSELPAVKNIDSFLMVMTRNKAIDLLRLQSNRVRKEEDYRRINPEQQYINQEQTILREGRNIVQQGIYALPERQQQIYILVEQQNKNLDEISHELGIKKSTVKSHLKAAKKALRAYLRAHIDMTVLLIILKLF